MSNEEKREYAFLKWCHAQKDFVVRDDSESTFYAGYDAAAEQLQAESTRLREVLENLMWAIHNEESPANSEQYISAMKIIDQ